MSRKDLIYSKRYPPPWEAEAVAAEVAAAWTPEERKTAEESFHKFWRKLHEESVYVPIPGVEKKARLFIDLAKRLSQIYELDIDIQRKAHFISADFHLYCAIYPGKMTQDFAELFSLCDQFASFVLTTEKSDFTLSLTLYTHKHYMSGQLINF